MFAKVFAGWHFHNYRELETKIFDFSVDVINQRIFIKTMPGLKVFLDSGDLQHVFGSCLQVSLLRLRIICQSVRS